MKNLLLLLCASTCFAFEAPEMKRTPLAKEIALFARHIQPEQGPKGPCDYLWNQYNKELRKYGFSGAAERCYMDFLA